MPCECPDAYADDARRAKALADKATRAACDMRTILRRAGLEKELTEETKRWIRKHDQEDAERIAVENENGLRERTRLKALKKLSLEERRVLGL